VGVEVDVKRGRVGAGVRVGVIVKLLLVARTIGTGVSVGVAVKGLSATRGVGVAFALSLVGRLGFGVGVKATSCEKAVGVKVAAGMAAPVAISDAPHAVNIDKRKVKEIIFLIIDYLSLDSYPYFTSTIKIFKRKYLTKV
jgi:hypothetical protein